MRPRMVIIAGPPGSGKSSAFSVAESELNFFNADDKAAQLNNGSYLNISPTIRSIVGKAFEDFVFQQIESKTSFAIETTLRTDVTFKQADLARKAGFLIRMIYVCAGSFDTCVDRVIARAEAGGHSTTIDQLRSIYDASLRNLPRAISEMDLIRIYDNSQTNSRPSLLLRCSSGKMIYRKETLPAWLSAVLEETHL